MRTIMPSSEVRKTQTPISLAVSPKVRRSRRSLAEEIAELTGTESELWFPSVAGQAEDVPAEEGPETRQRRLGRVADTLIKLSETDPIKARTVAAVYRVVVGDPRQREHRPADATPVPTGRPQMVPPRRATHEDDLAEARREARRNGLTLTLPELERFALRLFERRAAAELAQSEAKKAKRRANGHRVAATSVLISA